MPDPIWDADTLVARYDEVRSHTETLAAPLSPEDQTVQSMPDVSPTKWHRAHVTWFFETFVLAEHEPSFKPYQDRYWFLFNSYYEGVGPRYARAERGFISRPGAHDVGLYRADVDSRMRDLVTTLDGGSLEKLGSTIELGFHHEQQHQELLLMDIKHVLSVNPLQPSYAGTPLTPSDPDPLGWVDLEGGLVEVGHRGGGFGFDNELPLHQQWLEPYRLADRLVTNGEWLAFMADRGYERHELWLSDGWGRVRDEDWRAPFYWTEVDGVWFEHTLTGTRPVDAGLPVSHVSHYEADAYATWAGKRLPDRGRVGARRGRRRPGRPLQHRRQPRRHRDVPPARSRPQHRPPATGLRRLLGVDELGLPRLPGLPPTGRSDRRVQRQVHVGSDGAPWRVRPHPPGPRPALLPQLLPAGGALGPFRGASRRWRAALMPSREPVVTVALDPHRASSALVDDVRRGLGSQPRTLSPKWLYDDVGSELFDEITRLPEYYPTECERAILRDHAADIVAACDATTVVELGSGTSDKTRTLLDAFTSVGSLERFVPVDVSEQTLRDAAVMLSERYPSLRVEALVGDFTLHLGHLPRGGRRLVAFLGGTIGNFYVEERAAFLGALHDSLEQGDWFLLGTDLVKSTDRLISAYDDSRGVTAAFVTNCLQRAQPGARGGLRHRGLLLRALLGPAPGSDGPPAPGRHAPAGLHPRSRPALRPRAGRGDPGRDLDEVPPRAPPRRARGCGFLRRAHLDRRRRQTSPSRSPAATPDPGPGDARCRQTQA